MKYKSYNEKGSDRRLRKSSRKSVFAHNKDLHTARSKKELKAAKLKAAAEKEAKAEVKS